MNDLYLVAAVEWVSREIRPIAEDLPVVLDDDHAGIDAERREEINDRGTSRDRTRTTVNCQAYRLASRRQLRHKPKDNGALPLLHSGSATLREWRRHHVHLHSASAPRAPE